jgi:hypothetical protein
MENAINQIFNMNKDFSLSLSTFRNIFLFYPLFSPISWYPIVNSYYLVSSLQLPYGLGGDEGRKPCVLRNTTQPSRTGS